MNWETVRTVCMVLGILGAAEVIAFIVYIAIKGFGSDGDHYGGPF